MQPAAALARFRDRVFAPAKYFSFFWWGVIRQVLVVSGQWSIISHQLSAFSSVDNKAGRPHRGRLQFLSRNLSGVQNSPLGFLGNWRELEPQHCQSARIGSASIALSWRLLCLVNSREPTADSFAQREVYISTVSGQKQAIVRQKLAISY